MNIYILTVLYGPVFFLEKSLPHNYSILKNEGITFKHYLIDNNFPLEKNKDRIKELCTEYEIEYINLNKNIGMIGAHNYFAQEIQRDGILLNLEADAFLNSQGSLSTFLKLHESNTVPGITYFNNPKLNQYPKKIFTINNVKVFELILEGNYNPDFTWVQSFCINIKESLEVNKILLESYDNYDVPGEKSSRLKSAGRPILIFNDLYENMTHLRYSNYIEYQFYKSLVYFHSKYEESFRGYAFENFLKDYESLLYSHNFDSFYNSYKNNCNDEPQCYFTKTKNRILIIENKFKNKELVSIKF